MVTHSIDNKKNILNNKEIPKSVLVAEKILRSYYPDLYKYLSGYRNCKSNLQLENIRGRVEVMGFNWYSTLKYIILRFMNTFENTTTEGGEQ